MKIYLGTDKDGDFFSVLCSRKDTDSDFYNSYSDLAIYGQQGSGKTAFIKNEIRFLEAANKPSEVKYVIITDHPEEMDQFNNSLYIYDHVINMNNKKELDRIFDLLRKEKCSREEVLIRENLQSLDQIQHNEFADLIVFIDNASQLFDNDYFDDKYIFANAHVHIFNIISLDKPSELPPPYVHNFPTEIKFTGDANTHEYNLLYEGRATETVKAVIRSKEEWDDLLSGGASKEYAPIKLEIYEDQLEDLHKYLRNMPENKRILELFTMFEFYKKYTGALEDKYDETVDSLSAFSEKISNLSEDKLLKVKSAILDKIYYLLCDDEIECMKLGEDKLKISSFDTLNMIKYYSKLGYACNKIKK